MRTVLLLYQSVGLKAAILLGFTAFNVFIFPARNSIARLSAWLGFEKSLHWFTVVFSMDSSNPGVDCFACALMGFSNVWSGFQVKMSSLSCLFWGNCRTMSLRFLLLSQIRWVSSDMSHIFKRWITWMVSKCNIIVIVVLSYVFSFAKCLNFLLERIF